MNMPTAHEPTVAKVIELIGSSPKSFDDAIANAVREAAKTVRSVKGVYVKDLEGKVSGNKIVEYRAIVKISFVVERD
jgi:flavin-binding protein dodecin